MLLTALLAGWILALSGAALAWRWRPRTGGDRAPLPPDGVAQAPLLDHNPLGIALLRDRTFVWANLRWAQLLGLAPSHLHGLDIRSYHLDQAAYEAFGREAYPVLAQGRPYAADIRMRRVDGSPFWAHLTGNLLVPGQPEAGTVWCLEDVTARVEAEDERAEVLTLNQKLIASSPAGILLFRAADGACILANDAARRLLEAPGGDLLRESFRRQGSWAASGMLAAAEAALATGVERKLETCLLPAQGEDRWLDAQFVPFVSRGERLLLLQVMDVSERVLASRALRESQERYRVVVDSLNEGLAIVGEDLRFTFVNDRLARMLGYDPAEILGQYHTFILADEDLAYMEDRQRSRAAGARDNYEIRLKRKDGENLHAVLSVAPVVDAQGRPVASPVLVTDDSVRKRAEARLQAVQESLRQAHKMESLGRMAGGVAHDFNNLFQGLQGNLEMALRKVPGGTARPFLDKALDILAKASTLTHRMLDFTGKGQRETQVLNLNQLVRNCLATLPEAEAQFQAGAGLPAIEGDGAQLFQVLSGVVLNAREAQGPRGGSIQVATSLGPLPTEGTGVWIQRPASDQAAVCLTVADAGSGMSEEVLERAFDPFFTTRMPGRGLGLSAALGILRGHDAGLWVATRPGQGTTFRLFFAPRVADQAGPSAPMRPAGVPEPRRTILLVDDDEDLQEALAEFLRDGLGYPVLQARDGLEAVALYRRERARIGLVLMDATMPRLGGPEAFRAILDGDPGARGILCSGFSEESGTQIAQNGGFLGFLKKPFPLRLLEDTLREVLGDAP